MDKQPLEREQNVKDAQIARKTTRLSNEEYERRFWTKVERRSADECWPWRGQIKKPRTHLQLPYGVFGARPNREYAHRLSHIFSKGQIPDGHVVRHRCDNTLCVNPGHLLTGTPLQNSRDIVERGRQAKGSKNGAAVANEEKVREIRRLFASGLSRAEIRQRVGLAETCVNRIIRRVTWHHVL